MVLDLYEKHSLVCAIKWIKVFWCYYFVLSIFTGVLDIVKSDFELVKSKTLIELLRILDISDFLQDWRQRFRH